MFKDAKIFTSSFIGLLCSLKAMEDKSEVEIKGHFNENRNQFNIFSSIIVSTFNQKMPENLSITLEATVLKC